MSARPKSLPGVAKPPAFEEWVAIPDALVMRGELVQVVAHLIARHEHQRRSRRWCCRLVRWWAHRYLRRQRERAERRAARDRAKHEKGEPAL